MKFGKQLETQAEDIPSEWRPYLIQYKALKKIITKVAEEIESRGLSANLLHECLEDDIDEDATAPKIKYYFTGEAPDVKPNIEFTYDPTEPRVQEVLSKLMKADLEEDMEKPKLEFKRSQNNKDFFTISNSFSDQKTVVSPGIQRQRRSSAVLLVQELLALTTQERTKKQEETDETEKNEEEEEEEKENHHTDESKLKTLVIELEQDDEFFKMLVEELQQVSMLQDVTTQKFKQDISELEHRMTKVASPTQKTDMYNWRKIFSLYMDAQIFQGNAETDRSFRSVEKAKTQMMWFLDQLKAEGMDNNLKNRESKQAFEQFVALNTELITIKHYQILNQTAMRKILKKHDKRSGLTASQNFPEFISMDKLCSPKLARMLYATITDKLTTIVPQPDDYACPVCMSVAWRPIRLKCNHVFCVRCLIKAQKKQMKSCPMCRHPTSVEAATALNLDEGLQNFLKLYFPKEIKQKKRENEREQAIEDVQAMTGRIYTEEQLLRMNRPSDTKCNIM